MSAAPADVTVVLETETDGAPLRLHFPDTLAGIASQTARDRVLELLVVAPRTPTPEEKEALEASGLPFRWIERPGLRYYDLKNAGIEASRGRFVVLSDSDARPDPDFLACALTVFSEAVESVAALTGRSSYLPGPFALELAIAQLPNQSSSPGDTTNFLAHNVVFRGDVIRANLFHAGFIRLFPDTELANRLLAQGLRIVYRPEMRVTHNYARRPQELQAHCTVIGYHDARHRSVKGDRVVSAPLNAIGRFRVLVRRLWTLRRPVGIRAYRMPFSILFMAYYSVAVGLGYSAFRRGLPEPFAEF